MKARRTPWWHYVLAAMLGLLAGLGFAKYGEITGLPLVGAPWVVPVVLIALGLMVLVLALQVHKYTTKDPLKRAQLKPLDPQITALQFYSPIFLLLQLCDSNPQYERTAIELLQKHIRQFLKLNSTKGD